MRGCGSRQFCQREYNFDNNFFCLFFREDPNTTMSGPSAADDGPTLKPDLVAF